MATGGTLAMIGTGQENTVVTNIASWLATGGWWIGYTDSTLEGSFGWVDGGLWKDVPCSTGLPFAVSFLALP